MKCEKKVIKWVNERKTLMMQEIKGSIQEGKSLIQHNL